MRPPIVGAPHVADLYPLKAPTTSSFPFTQAAMSGRMGDAGGADFGQGASTLGCRCSVQSAATRYAEVLNNSTHVTFQPCPPSSIYTITIPSTHPTTPLSLSRRLLLRLKLAS